MKIEISLKANLEKVANGFIVIIYGGSISEEKRFIAVDYQEVKEILEREVK